MSDKNRITLGPHRTIPRYWSQEGAWLDSAGKNGPPQIPMVSVNSEKILLDFKELNAGEARWLGCRLIEAAALFEQLHTGDVEAAGL